MKILVIQLRRIGDILLTTPAISYLKQVFPNAQIDFLAESMGKTVLEKHPDLNTFLTYDKNHPIQAIKNVMNENYDVIIDFMNNPRTGLLSWISGVPKRVALKKPIRSIYYNILSPGPAYPMYVPLLKIDLIQYWLKQENLPTPTPNQIRPRLYLTEDEKQFADQWIHKELNQKDFVILVPTHRHPVRRWRLEGFRELAQKMNKEIGHKVFLAYGPGEEGLVNQIRKGYESVIQLLPPTTLRQMAAIFSRAKLVVTNDSGPMHVAVSVGVPTVTIYGPTRPVDWNPSLAENKLNPTDIAISSQDVACLGCHLNKCPVGHLCMERLNPNDVFKECISLL